MGIDTNYLIGCEDWVKIYVMWLDYWNIIKTIQVFAIMISSTSKVFIVFAVCCQPICWRAVREAEWQGI